MAGVFKKTVSASKFKAKCFAFLDAAAAHKLDRVRITKRGKPFVTPTLAPDHIPAPATSRVEAMKGTTNISDDRDGNSPTWAEAELDAIDARRKTKFADPL